MQIVTDRTFSAMFGTCYYFLKLINQVLVILEACHWKEWVQCLCSAYRAIDRYRINCSSMETRRE